MEVSSIEFLNKHDTIDYNTWIKKGIPYYKEEEIKRIQKRLEHTIV